MQISWKSPNAILATLLMIFTFGLFLLVVLKGLGGTEALFAILGHVAAWCEIVVIFFWRRSPPSNNNNGG